MKVHGKTLKLDYTKKRLLGTVEIPSSKSLTNRALVISALASGESVLRNPLECEDTLLMVQALKDLGVRIDDSDSSRWIINGTGGRFYPDKSKLNAGIAGTTSRFLTALSLIIPNEIEILGKGRLLQRPIYPLVDALVDLGVSTKYLGHTGCLPLIIKGGQFKGGEVSLEGHLSSQYFSGLLMVAPLLENGLRIKVIGEQISKSYIDVTLGILEDFGIVVENNNYTEYIVRPGQQYQSRDYLIEGDWSSASYFCALAAIHPGSRLKLKCLKPYPLSKQGDAKFPVLVKKMGANIYWEDADLVIEGSPSLQGIEVNMENMPDTAISLAMASVWADTPSLITGLSSLKIKETDRLLALQKELNRVGIKSKTTDDSIEIFPGLPYVSPGDVMETYDDHRMAMGPALLGTKISNMVIKNPNVVAKSFPTYWEKLESLGLELLDDK